MTPSLTWVQPSAPPIGRRAIAGRFAVPQELDYRKLRGDLAAGHLIERPPFEFRAHGGHDGFHFLFKRPDHGGRRLMLKLGIESYSRCARERQG